MDKLIGFILSFQNLEIEKLIFRDLNLLLFLLGLLIIVLFLGIFMKTKSKRRASLGVSSLTFFKPGNQWLNYLLNGLFFIAVGLLIISLLNPVLPLVKNKKQVLAKEIMVVLDFSSSMTNRWREADAEYDYSYNYDENTVLKIDIEIEYVIKFIKSRENDGMGLIVYSDNAYLVSPFNYDDPQAVISLIKLFGVEVSPYGGLIPDETMTATGDALFLADDHFEHHGRSKEKIIVLFTDGQANEGRSIEDFFKEQKSEAKLFVLGVNYSADYGSGEILAREAEISGGGYFSIDTEQGFQKAINTIDQDIGDNRIVVDEYVVDKPFYHYFAFVGLVLLMLVFCLKNLPFLRDLL
ncbi:MAG: vWA domain-containing protein [Elusimicrobiota bacterium]